MSARWLELALLFGVVPCGFAWIVRRIDYRGAMFPVLWVLTCVCGAMLWRDPTFDRAVLWRLPLLHPHVSLVVQRFCALSLALAVVSRCTSPAWFLWLPRNQPKLWWLLLVGYPWASALPQGMIWRVFFAHRYAPILEHAPLLAAGGVAFGLAHVAFRNPIAIAMTAAGGVLFLDTYLTTGSMLLATLEHGAYGIAVFTFGLGRFVYLAARPLSRGLGNQRAASA